MEDISVYERLGNEGEMFEFFSSINADCDIIGRVGSIDDILDVTIRRIFSSILCCFLIDANKNEHFY